VTSLPRLRYRTVGIEGTAAAVAAAASGEMESGGGPGAPSIPSDKRASFVPGTDNVFGCKHYRRGCRIISPCCNEIYTCRLCHAEAVLAGDLQKVHKLDRCVAALMHLLSGPITC